MRIIAILALIASIIAAGCTAAEPGQLPPSAPQAPEADDNAPQPPALPAADTTTVKEVAGGELKEPDFVYPFIGNEKAPVTVVEYADFSDGISSRMAFAQINSIKRDYVNKNKAKLVFKPYPLLKDGRLAAEASLCTWEQGSVPFWAYHDTLFQFFVHLDNVSLHNYVSRIPNADKAEFAKCMQKGKYAATIQKTLDEGKAAGITEAPTLIIGSKNLTGETPYSLIKKAIDDELKANGKAGQMITGNAVFQPDVFSRLRQSIASFLKQIAA